MIRAINALAQLITFIGKKPKINTKYKKKSLLDKIYDMD